MEKPSKSRVNMTQDRQTEKNLLPNLLSMKSITEIGTWNVRSMFEIRSYSLQVIGLCETRLIKPAQTEPASGELIFYYGHTIKVLARDASV